MNRNEERVRKTNRRSGKKNTGFDNKFTFETAIIERYKRRETSVEEALIEMYLAGVSVRRVEETSQKPSGEPRCLQEP